jgi:DNA-binding MarR family transcriptional regulator
MSRESRPELARLFEEVVRFYLSLNHIAAIMHRHGERSGARRTVLMTLARTGPATVAQIARARHEARQRIQPLVNALVKEGILEYARNPAHKRSPLVKLTKKGDAVVRRMGAIEATARARLGLDVSPQALTSAANVLQRVRGTLDQKATRQMIAEVSRSKR